MRINEALAEVMGAIGDDPDYASALHLLREAESALSHGTTAEATTLLDQALKRINEVCPL